MTKQQPYATKRHLSKLFRAIMVLGALKLALFVAIAMDVPIPTLSFDFGGNSEQKPQSVAPSQPAETRVSGVWTAPVNNIEAKDDVNDIPLAEVRPEPQGAAAIEAAKSYKNNEIKAEPKEMEPDRPLAAYLEKEEKKTVVQSAPKVPTEPSIGELLVSSDIDLSRDPVLGMNTAPATDTVAAKPEEGEKSGQWWKNILNINKLPIPRMGAEQVAHAASLDMPPAPSVKPSGNPSPFMPPSEQMPVIPNAQDSEGRILPLRNAGPQGQNAATPGSVGQMTRSAPVASGTPSGYANSNVLRQQEDLARREQEVLMLKQQMDIRLNDLRDAEKKIQDMLQDAKAAEDAKYKSLINMYRNMKPKQAAQALASMEERVAVKILSGMSPKEAGEILSYADPKKTAKLSELITRMNMPGN